MRQEKPCKRRGLWLHRFARHLLAILPLIAMVAHVCPSHDHALASTSFALPSHSPAFSERQSCFDTRASLSFSPPSHLRIRKSSENSGLRSCRGYSLRYHFGPLIAPPELHKFSLSASHWPGVVGGCHRLDCRGNACLRRSPPERQMSVSEGLPDARQRIPAAARDNAGIETNDVCSAEMAKSEHYSDQDCKSAIPGIIFPSVKTIGKSTNIVWQDCLVKREEKENLLGQKGCVIWITGLSGSGKSTVACALDRALLNHGKLSYVLDGDNLRHGLNKNLGFSAEDRTENIRRIGEVARIFVDAGIICIASAISPYRKDRDACRKLLKPGEFIEVFMNFPLNVCEERDPKGLYKLARAGKIKGFTGVDDPYEAPFNCEVVMEPIDGKCPSPVEMAARLVSYLQIRGFLHQPI